MHNSRLFLSEKYQSSYNYTVHNLKLADIPCRFFCFLFRCHRRGNIPSFKIRKQLIYINIYPGICPHRCCQFSSILQNSRYRCRHTRFNIGRSIIQLQQPIIRDIKITCPIPGYFPVPHFFPCAGHPETVFPEVAAVIGYVILIFLRKII